MRKLLYLFIITSAFSSCRKEINVPDEEAELIFGDWEWFLSTNTGWYSESSPASEGYEKEVIIERTGKYTNYVNGEKDETRKFKLIKDPERICPTPYLIVFNNNDISLMVYKLSEDTIAFYPYRFNDAAISYYKRKY